MKHEWPSYANITSWRLYLEAFTSTGGNEYSRERGDFERVVGEFAIAPMCIPEAVKFSAMLDRMKMTGETLGVPVPQSSAPTAPVRAHHQDSDGELTPFSDGFAYTDFVLGAGLIATPGAAAAGDTTLSLTGISDPDAVAPGSWVSSGSVLFQITSSTSTGADSYSVNIKPPLRQALLSTHKLLAGAAVAKLRLRLDKPAPEVVFDFSRNVSQPIILELEEVY